LLKKALRFKIDAVKKIILSIYFFSCLLKLVFAVNYLPNEIIIKTKKPLAQNILNKYNTTAQSQQDPILNKYTLQKIHKLNAKLPSKKIFFFFSTQPKINLYRLVLEQNQSLSKVIKEYQTNDNIVWAQPNYIYQKNELPNDPLLSEQTNLSLINMPNSWSQTSTTPPVIIAVIDTGIDYNHPDLKNQIWTNDAEIPNDNLDNDHNNYIDDYQGWNFSSDTNDNFDQDGHGTNISGIIAAQTNNQIGIASVGYNCQIMPLKASHINPNTNTEIFNTTDIAEAIFYAIDHQAKIINMSFGGYLNAGTDTLLHEAIKIAYNQGLIMVASAGNDHRNLEEYNSIPNVYPEVISVSAVAASGEIASYSNYGKYIDFAAPGNHILTTNPNNTYSYVTGTSMAAPQASGLIGLLLSQNSAANVYDILAETAQDKGSTDKDIYYGYGLIDVEQALSYQSLDLGLATINQTWQIVNAPNPFNPQQESTYICYELTQQAQINLYIYSLNSKLIKHIVREDNSGYHEVEWNGKDQTGQLVPNGVYILIAQAQSGDTTIIKKTKIAVLK
jgi:subtilisin family serine protease